MVANATTACANNERIAIATTEEIRENGVELRESKPYRPTMTVKTLKELRNRTPFKPFELHLADGNKLPVVSTDHLFFFPTHAELMVVLPGGGFRFVDPALVVSAGSPGTSRTKHAA